MSTRQLLSRSTLALTLLVLTAASLADIGPIPMSIKGLATPPVPGLLDGPEPIVVDKAKAIALGKALFWDANVGSDGVACASCHFHAGADRRVRNQLHPNGKGSGAAVFEASANSTLRGVNQTLSSGDFPFVQWAQPLTDPATNTLLRQSDDVVGSAGSFGGSFKAIDYEAAHDLCVRSPDGQAQLGGIGARRVTQRQAPSVINAVFNHKLMWDGRANNIFNGSSAWGPRDATAGVWVDDAAGLRRVALALSNSALASQAMLAPIDERETSCTGRTLADVGRKLLYRDALSNQMVHPTDSVLGPYARGAQASGTNGLTLTYYELVTQSFNPKYWRSKQRGPFGKSAVAGNATMRQAYSQVESNFPMFFGLALQLYQSTLVSDDSPFDRSPRNASNLPTGLTPEQLRGLQVFRTAHCALCHTGPAFTTAAIDLHAPLVASHPWAFGDSNFRNTTSSNVVARIAGTKGFGFVDTGFAASGVAQDGWDPGLAGLDSNSQAWSYAAQYLQYLAGNAAAVKDARVKDVRPCDLASAIALNTAVTYPFMFSRVQGLVPQSQATTGCLRPTYTWLPTPAAAAAELTNPASKRMLAVTDAAFKIPGLRNVELTGPFMHNGSMATLEQVIEFYARGGNFKGASMQFGTVFGQGLLQGDPQARADLKSFLESLTDERVRYERAPFDHPELKVWHGHTGDRTRITATNALGHNLGQDEVLVVPAIGAGGRSTPLLPFSAYLAP